MTVIWKPEGEVWFDLLRLVCHGLMLAIFMGFLGAVIPVGDSLAVFRIEFTVLLAIAALIAYLLGRTLIPILSIVTISVSALSIWPFVGTGAPVDQPDFRVHQHNVLFGNKELDRLVEELRGTGADVLMLQEVWEENFERIRAGLEDIYPHYQLCVYSRGGVAVMMRNTGPLLDYGCLPKSRLAWMRVGTAQGPVTVGSMHQLWPWPKGQFWQKDNYADEISRLSGPLILAGDFNNVPWSATARTAAKAAGGRLARGLGRSYVFSVPWPRFRIDHVIVPIDAEVQAWLTPGWGSDHLGVSADVRLAPASP